jgi:serine/threonine protein kinase
MPSNPVSRKELAEPEPTAFGAARDGPRDVGQGQHSIHERETRVGGASGNGAAADGSAADSGPAAVAGLDEFRRALVEIGIIGEDEVDGLSAGVRQFEGIVGLSRALQAAGRLTPYQAAAIYQRKSRGLLIGNYLILDKLGAGGMGMVFKARHRRLNRIVALKILPPSFARDRTAVLRFKREVEAAGRLKHPNIVAALDADEDRGVHFLVMEYVEGRDLDQLVRQRGPLSVIQTIDFLVQAARGLEAAHAEGIVHRDIKPSNLMLDSQGVVRVLDLGLARIVEASQPLGAAKVGAGRLTESGTYMGTVDFMAPEQAEDSRRADHLADIYSLGCTLFFLLAGREPFGGETVIKRLMAHQERPAPTLFSARPEVPPVLEEIYQKMMAKRPLSRPGSMGEVITLLEVCQAMIAETSAARGDRTKSRPTLLVFNEANLKRAAPAGPGSEASVLARREPALGADLGVGPDLSLEDLITDVRPETEPAPLPPATVRRATEPRSALASRRSVRSRSAHRRRRGHPSLVLTLGSIGLLAVGSFGFLISRSPTRPTARKPAPKLSVEERPHTNLDVPRRKPASQDTIAERIDKNGALVIRSTKSARAEQDKVMILGNADSTKTAQLRAKLDEPIRMPFPVDTPLVEVLRYVQRATTTPSFAGIPISVDPAALQEVDGSLKSPVRIDLEGVPLKTSLRLVAEQLRLAYYVSEGKVIISSPKIIQQRVEKEDSENKGKKDQGRKLVHG